MPNKGIRVTKKWLQKYSLWVAMIGVILILSGLFLTTVIGPKPTIVYTAMKPSNVITGPPGNEFKNPMVLAVGLKGELYIADRGNQRVIVMEEDGRFSMAFGGPGSGRAELGEPVGIDVALNGNVYVADRGKQAVLVFNDKGEYLYTISGENNGNLQPLCVKTNKQGNAYLFSRTAKKFWIYNSQGEKTGEFPARKIMSSNDITALDLDPEEGRIFGVNSKQSKYFEFSGDNTVVHSAAELGEPAGIVYNRSKKIVFISDAYNNKIVVYDKQGKYLGEFGKSGDAMGEFKHPAGMAFDETGKLYIADSGNNRILVYIAGSSGGR